MTGTQLVPLLLILVGACSPALPQGEFGPYYRKTKRLAIAPGESLKVYRVKEWTFSSGEAPALQLEYEPPFSIADTAAIHREAILLWPSFAPYVEAQHLDAAIITATNLRIHGLWPVAWTSDRQSFGFIASRNAAGQWYIQGDTAFLPPADPSGVPRIMDVTGKPLPLDLRAGNGPH